MNCLTVSLQNTILTLHAQGWTARRIARELDVHRETVGRHIQNSKPAKVTPGASPEDSLKPAEVTLGDLGSVDSKPAMVTLDSEVRCRSECEQWRVTIELSLISGLSAKRIWQDLQADHGFKASYQSVKRFARTLAASAPLPFRRMETAAGEEMQVDFGQGAPVIEDGKRRRPHVFRVTLSFSRKGYSEVVWHQDTESFIRCLENAFRHFGGSVRTVVIDNLKAGVLQADWFDPEINPKLASFALHYGVVIMPTKPCMPRHKGKVEAGVKYVQENALKSKTFSSLGEQNIYLSQWELRVADKRIHGTVRQQVEALFLAQERSTLQALPAELFPSFIEAKRRVHRDGFVEYKKAYYSVPPEHVAREVWVRGDSRLLHVYTLQMRQIAVHTLVEPGRFATQETHLHPFKRNAIERGVSFTLERCKLIGPNTGAWAQAMYQNRGPMGVRVMQGLLHLARKHTASQIEQATAKATHHGCWRLRDLRRLMEQGDSVVQIDFLQAHPLIRDLSNYSLSVFDRQP